MRKILIYTMVAFGLCACVAGRNSDTGDAIPDSAPADTLVEELAEVEEIEGWVYNESVDEMTDKVTYTATLISENSVQFGFPYEGDTYMNLMLRDSPEYGKDIVIQVTQGQFMTDLFDGRVKVRFDDEPAMTVLCKTPSDHSTNILFLTGYNKLVDKFRKAKKVRIAAEFFQEGSHTFTFDTEGLQWNH